MVHDAGFVDRRTPRALASNRNHVRTRSLSATCAWRYQQYRRQDGATGEVLTTNARLDYLYFVPRSAGAAIAESHPASRTHYRVVDRSRGTCNDSWGIPSS